nr:hypothetical protein [Mycobacterium europaeum]MEA1158863.1 hypothetical protein [Mycobacterium europaeum]
MLAMPVAVVLAVPYPMLVRPSLAGAAGQNKFVWPHRAGRTESTPGQGDSTVTKVPAAVR